MSSIPSNAMPHAGPGAETETASEGGATLTLAGRVKEQAERVAELARENPKTAIAAGAAVVAGVVAAAAIPLVKGRRAKATGAAKPARKAPARKPKS